MRGAALLLVALSGAPAKAAVSFSREVAPILALHCNSCHGEAGGLSTRSYPELMRGGNKGAVIVPGNPGESLLVQFVDGRRGDAHRMPLGGQPLALSQIETLRNWIAEGAKRDDDATPRFRLERKVRVNRAIRITCRVPAAAYLSVEIHEPESGKVLYREVATVKQPRDPGDAGEPNERLTWTVQPERGWPPEVIVLLTVSYAAGDVSKTELTVQ